jgi:hypothetical protein
MRKLLISILLIIFISNFFLIKTLARENIFTSPLLIFNNPALLSKQQGMPIGLEIKLNSLDSINLKTLTVCGGLSYSFENKAVAIGYENSNENSNILSTGFSLSMLISSFGAALKVENSGKSLLPNIDLSYMLKINKSLIFNIIMKNIFTQYHSSILYPELSSYFHGEWNRLNFELGYKGVFTDYNNLKPLNSLEMLISYEFLKNKNLYTALENSIYQNTDEEIITEISVHIGINIRNGKFNNGLSTGYQHRINNSKGKIVNNILINPLFYTYKKAQNFKINYKCSQNVDNELVFNIDNVDKGEDIKSWSLIITDYDDEKKIIKSFSGGNIPPKIIVWDFKDSFGTIFSKNRLKAQLLALDKNKNYSVSPVIIIYQCNTNN